MTTDAETWALVDDQRRRTIALLESLSPADWDAPSLCTDWTVKDLVGHLAWQRAASSASSLPGTIAAMLRARGSMDAAISDLATRWAAGRSADALVAEVRQLPGHHRIVIGTTVANHLIDAIVHHHDIALALGRGLDADPAAAAVAADSTWSLPKGFTLPVTRRLVAFRWRATDTNWDLGEGPLVEGPMVAIECALMGRAAAGAHLSGPGLTQALEVVGSPA
ncbi:maleylpyruvate isomerase family mycothiol-dependent enzyme [Propioniciclava sinopodophylli]|uniref:maleylpyruvate isomerase family mycothiol-dependent enzyme n=1 Tax=Propioniciclava sinopodophylli TaxID=1837344 RepID=UPI002490C9FE|nr:maleylpyruvate isomerase family mycothiol-dependent enzyme [Propioniciclava sinopodophylli]